MRYIMFLSFVAALPLVKAYFVFVKCECYFSMKYFWLDFKYNFVPVLLFKYSAVLVLELKYSSYQVHFFQKLFAVCHFLKPLFYILFNIQICDRVTLFPQLTYSLTRFGIYETVKAELTKGDASAMPFYQKVLAGGVAGALGGFVGTPADLVNVRYGMQFRNEMFPLMHSIFIICATFYVMCSFVKNIGNWFIHVFFSILIYS